MSIATPASSPSASPTEEVHHIPLSIRLLRLAKPAIVALLRSPVHALLSRDVLLLTWTGRRSGKSFTLPLSYVAVGESLYLCTKGSGWWRNLKGGVRAEVRLRGRSLAVSATVLDPDSTEARDGLRAFVTRNPRTGVMLYKVQRGSGGLPVESDVERETKQSVVVRLVRR